MEIASPPLPWFPLAEQRRRAHGTSAALQSAGLDCLVAFANRVQPGHVRYLTGYETQHGIHDCALALFLPGPEPQVSLFTNVSWDDIRAMSWAGDMQIVSTERAAAAIAERLPARKLNIGIAGLRWLPAPIFDGLRQCLPTAEFRDASELMLRLRMVKSPAEIAALRRSAAIADAGAQAFLEAVRPGCSERFLQAEVERAMTLAGSEGLSFATQIGAGERTAQVCMYPSDRPLRTGELVQLDCGGIWHGYRGDISRMARVPPLTSRSQELLDTVSEMYESMLAAVRPGPAAGDIARIGMAVAKAHDCGDYLYRSPNHEPGFMGHGIGCSYSEPPEITPEDATVLQTGMVLVIEPILAVTGVAGVKLEDAVLVTESGMERLSRCPLVP